MVNLGTVNEDATVYFYYSTAAADGGEEDWSATLEQADIIVHKDGSAMTLDASTITPANVATGLQKVTIDLSNDSGFTGGSTYWVMVDASDETIDSQAVSGVLGVFSIESAPEKAVRILREKLYPTDSEISTTTSNSTTAINMGDVVDAQTPDAALIGMILAVHDATDDRVEHVVVTAASSLVATVQRLGDGTAMSFTVASGDHVWIVGYSDLGDDGTHLSEAGGDGDHLTAVPYNSAWDAEIQSEVNDGLVAYDAATGADVAALNDPTVVEIRSEMDSNSTQLAAIVADTDELQGDWADGGRLDLLLDAIKVVTDALGSTAAATLALSMDGVITGAAATGTLSTTQATTDLTGFADDQLIGGTIYWTSGAAEGERSSITDYANASGLVTFDALTTAPGDGDTFFIA